MIHSIVLNLQRKVYDNSTKVTDLLKEANIVAKRIPDYKIYEWICSEMQGYAEENVPEYRKIKANICVFNIHKGILYIPGTDSKKMEVSKKIYSSIKQIEDFYYNSQEEYFILKCPILSNKIKNTILEIQREEAKKILVGVRQKLGKWLNEIEKKENKKSYN